MDDAPPPTVSLEATDGLRCSRGVNPSDGLIHVRPVAGQQIAGRVIGLDKPGGSLVKISRGSVHLFAHVQADLSFSFQNAPDGSWRVELLQGHTQLATHERIEAGTTDLRLVVDR